MVKGSIIFNCLEVNANLREFSRGDCFVDAIPDTEHLNAIGEKLVRLHVSYEAFGAGRMVTAEIQLSRAAWLSLAGQVATIHGIAWLDPT